MWRLGRNLCITKDVPGLPFSGVGFRHHYNNSCVARDCRETLGARQIFFSTYLKEFFYFHEEVFNNGRGVSLATP